jgi:predicted phage-related endonuclease
MLTAEQLKQRRGKITSSVVAACLGLDEYTTPLAAWAQIHGEGGGVDTKATQRGSRLEGTILEYGAAEVGAVLYCPAFVSHDTMPWAGDSADAIYLTKDGTQYVAEAKSVGFGSADKWGEEGTDQIPQRVLAQCHWHLIHWPECTRCAVPVLIGGYEFEFRLYWVDRSASIEESLLGRLKRWHDRYIIGNERPEAGATDDGWLKERYPHVHFETLEDPEALAKAQGLAISYHSARAYVKSAEENKRLIAARIRELMGTHGSAKGEGFSISYRGTKDRTSVNWEQIAKDLQAPEETIQKHTRVVPGPRTLRVTLRGPEKGKKK